MCLKSVSRRAGHKKQVRMLDLGCGTGRFAIPFAYRLGYSVTAVDSSREMIDKARQKDPKSLVTWVVQDVISMELDDSSFDVIFMSHLLHHLDYPYGLLRKSFRILKNDGAIFNRYGALEHIRNDPEHKFFPEALTIDELRCPTIVRVEAWLREAGFTGVRSKIADQPTYDSGWDRLSKVKLKSTSVLTFIDQQSFEEGLKRFEKYVSAHSLDPWLMSDRMTITSGLKSK